MTDEIYEATKKFCGAMAVSWYKPNMDALSVIKRAGKYGIKVNIHFMLNKRSLPEAIELMQSGSTRRRQCNRVFEL